MLGKSSPGDSRENFSEVKFIFGNPQRICVRGERCSDNAGLVGGSENGASFAWEKSTGNSRKNFSGGGSPGELSCLVKVPLGIPGGTFPR